MISQPCPHFSRSPGSHSALTLFHPSAVLAKSELWEEEGEKQTHGVFLAGVAGSWGVGAMGLMPLHPGTGHLCLQLPHPARMLSTPLLSSPPTTCFCPQPLGFLAGLPLSSLRVLQSAFHITTRAIFPCGKFDNASPYLSTLRWAFLESNPLFTLPFEALLDRCQGRHFPRLSFLVLPTLQPHGLISGSHADGRACCRSQKSTPWSTTSPFSVCPNPSHPQASLKWCLRPKAFTALK